MDYPDFLKSKIIFDKPSGFSPRVPVSDVLFPFQRDVVAWALQRGRAAMFEDCGLGKTLQQLEWASHVSRETGGKVLILTPLAVADQTVREAEKLDLFDVGYAPDQSKACGITVTNYEKLHRFDASEFQGVVLDESSILKSYDGKTRTRIIEAFRQTPYRLACTATPAPNDYMELGNHAEFLGVMSRTEMLATFFVHDGGDTSKWRLKGHAEKDFWRWICTWAVNIRKPSDLGYTDGDFTLPKLNVFEHVVETPSSAAGLLLSLPASTLAERREARKGSLPYRLAKAAELANSNDEQWLVWCDLNAESEGLASLIRGAVEVTGSDSDDKKAEAMRGFSDGKIRALVTKPSIAGFGMNWQHCRNMVFVGLSDSYEQFYQALRRCYRFGQKNPVNAHVVISNLEGAVLQNIQRKEGDAERMAAEMVKHMAEITKGNFTSTVRGSIEYQPSFEITIPKFLFA